MAAVTPTPNIISTAINAIFSSADIFALLQFSKLLTLYVPALRAAAPLHISIICFFWYPLVEFVPAAASLFQRV